MSSILSIFNYSPPNALFFTDNIIIGKNTNIGQDSDDTSRKISISAEYGTENIILHPSDTVKIAISPEIENKFCNNFMHQFSIDDNYILFNSHFNDNFINHCKHYLKSRNGEL